jgi:hypothetical protein
MMPRYAVIPTRDRPDELKQCLDSIRGLVNGVIVVDNSDYGPINQVTTWWADESPQRPPGVHTHTPVRGWPPNLSHLWNVGLRWAEREARTASQDEWLVAVLNDDVTLPPNWFDVMEQAMRETGAAAASSGAVPTRVHHIKPGVTALHERMEGHAFCLAGHRGLRADERLRWWCGDNDLDMQARQAGGTVITPGPYVRHLYPDQSTARHPELMVQTGVDMAAFVAKWGFRPWEV